MVETLLRTSVRLDWAALTHPGLVRSENEDAWYTNEEIQLFVVSDGMGGHRGGALASQIVIEDLPVLIETGFYKLRSKNPRPIRNLLKKTIAEQSHHVYLEGGSEAGYKDMGATVAVAFFHANRTFIGNLGDSRIYRWRNGQLRQISKDHSATAELIDKGVIQPHEAEEHEYHGQITRYIGMEEKAKPYVRSFIPESKDRFLLCTDGLTDMVDVKEIADILQQDLPLGELCQSLVRKANDHGGHDNITALLIDCL